MMVRNEEVCAAAILHLYCHHRGKKNKNTQKKHTQKHLSIYWFAQVQVQSSVCRRSTFGHLNNISQVENTHVWSTVITSAKK